MTILSDLPPELLLEIVGHLSKRHCRKLALCCRYLCEIARTSLFYEISFGWNKNGDPDGSEVPLEFLRFIIENPSVRRAIRVIESAVDDYEEEIVDTTLDCDVDIPRDDAVIISDSLAAKKAGSGVDGTAYARALEALVPHAASVGMRNGVVLLGGAVGRLVLLMHYLPHVTSFTFHSRCPTHSFFAHAFQGRLSGGLPQGFSCLTEIHIIRPPAPYDQVGSNMPTHNGQTYDPSCNCAVLLFALFELPSLQSLHVYGFLDQWAATTDHPPGPTSSPNAKFPRASPLKILILGTSHITYSTLQHISSIPRALTRFALGGIVPSDIGVEDCISDLLYDHAATLKRLDITQDYFQKRQPLVSYRLGSIASFSVLSELTIDYRMVQSQLNRDARAGFPIHLILPPSLVLLTIRLGNHAPWTLPDFQAKTLMPQCWVQEKTHFPSLTALHVNIPGFPRVLIPWSVEEEFNACGIYLNPY